MENVETVFNGVNLVASGTSATDKTPALKVTGDKDFTLKNSNVSGNSRNALLVKTSGNVNITGNTFDAGTGNIYNAIEFGIGTDSDVNNVSVVGNTFLGSLGNNAISMYNFSDGAVVDISDNTFSNIAPNNNPIRLSNPKNVSATFNISDNNYTIDGEAAQYTGFMLLQDYSTGENKQDFSKFTINFTNLKRGDTKLVANGEGLNRVYYVYDDQDGILDAGVNDPVVNFA